VFVDDILLTGDDDDEMTALKANLDETFKIKDLGPIHYFLGTEVLHNADGLILTQRKFVKELLQEFRNPQAAPVTCPLDITTKLTADGGEPLSSPTLYKKIVGKLNFLTNTRPDLAFAVQHLSQFMQQPQVPHYNAVQHVRRCLQRYPDLGILLDISTDFTLSAYCDSDWDSCSHTCKSASGYVVFLGKKSHFMEVQEARHHCTLLC